MVVTIIIPPAPPKIKGNAGRLEYREISRLRAAAHYARKIYPGALGELVSRELNATADLGCSIGIESLISRLASEVLTTPVQYSNGITAET
jgi:hypothetical protein